MKAIIFDFFGVISSELYWIWLRDNISNLELQRDYFKELFRGADKGMVSHKAILKEFSKQTNKSTDTIDSEIKKILHINKDVLNLITSL